jgi:PHP family Zn ribbon phosphoesterase
VLSDSATRTSIRQSNIVHRSILQQAWHVVTNVDAFCDSDDEDIDESSRHAYTMRLQVLNDFHQNINTSIRPRHLQRAS